MIVQNKKAITAKDDYANAQLDEIRRLNNFIMTLMNSESTYSLLLDCDLNVIYYSDSFLDLFVLHDGKVRIGMPFADVLELIGANSIGDNAKNRFSRIVAGESEISEDETIVWPSGERRIYRITYKRVLDKNKVFNGILIFAQDLTDLRLEEAERRLNDLMRSTILPCIVWDEEDHIVAYNSEVAKIFGATQGMPPGEFEKLFLALQPEYQPDGRETESIRKYVLQESFERGFSQATVRLIRHDGTYVYFTVNVSCISWLFSHRFVIYFYDMTDILAKEAETREAEERIKLMLDTNPLICILRNDEGEIIDCNQVAMNILGIPNKADFCDAFHRRFPNLVDEKVDVAGKKERLMDILNRNGYHVLERMFYTATGEPIPVESKIVKIPWHDNFYYLSFSRDLREEIASKQKMLEATEREQKATIQREAAQAANEAKSLFLANMSHEIRTPMNSIIGFSELAMDDDISSKTRYYLSQILENSTWLLNIINNLLDISKIESGRMELECIPFDLADVISYCKSSVTPQALEKNIELVFDQVSLVSSKLVGDPTKLRQVLLNLLSNAVKFTDEGEVNLTLNVISETDSEITVGFEVKDSGIGITSELISNIYEPFMQADTSITRKYGGTGLGLPITKSILELMGSKLEVESVSGVGSKFYFQLTFNTIDITDEAFSNLSTGLRLKKPSFNGTVLLCEDNKINQRVITEHLSRVGLDTEVAVNGSEGVAKVKSRVDNGKKPYDLVFMDIHMPVMDGLKAAPLINELETGTPVIAVTADIRDGNNDFYAAFGMVDCVCKPFTSQDLWRCLLKYLTPVRLVDTEEKDEVNDSRLLKQLKSDFVRGNQDTYDEIADAINTGDITLAHRLAHTLKGTAGLIGEPKLQRIAADVEALLKGGVCRVDDALMSHLQSELNTVLEDLAPYSIERYSMYQSGAPATVYDSHRAKELIEKLETLLMRGSTECLQLADSLRNIPGSERLMQQIEDFDFSLAVDTLAGLKEKMEACSWKIQ